MPVPNSSNNRPAPTRKTPFIGLVVIFLLAFLLVFFITSRFSRSHAPAPVATAPGTGTIGRQHIYSETALPADDISNALAQATQQHKRVLLDFGGDWCGDCQALDFYFHQPPNDTLLQTNFILVHVWIGHMDRNIDIAAKYGVPISKGVPALAVLDANGKVLYAQATGQFSDMRHMEPTSVSEFLKTWKS